MRMDVCLYHSLMVIDGRWSRGSGKSVEEKGKELKVKGGDPLSRNSLKFHFIPISGILKSFYDYYREELWNTMNWLMMRRKFKAYSSHQVLMDFSQYFLLMARGSI